MAKKKKSQSSSLYIPNKEAHYNYTLLEELTAGIQLKGSEVKAIRQGRTNLKGSYCSFRNHELFLKGMHVGPYSQAPEDAHEPMRNRKLLLKKRELRKLYKAKEEKRSTIVVKNLFLNDKGIIKAQIATAKGKNVHDKRIAIKERDLARERERSSKY